MRVLIVNSVYGAGSTGRICGDIAKYYQTLGHEVRIAYGRGSVAPNVYKNNVFRIGNWLSVCVHGVLTRLFDLHGSDACSYFSTKRFLRWANNWNPDIVWLHNIHGYYLNYELLFNWLKKHPEINVKWTLHDCWAFTGHCSHFQCANCSLWKSGCYKCPEKKEYPASLGLSRARRNWLKKKKAFCGVERLTLISPSKWLADLTKESFLRGYPVEVINNTIDEAVFRNTSSDIREEIGGKDKILILGVANVWDKRKGFQDFLELRELLSNRYLLLLVGLNNAQIKSLPNGIVGISKTNSKKDLAALYSSADWFFNPTHEDNYPTVNLEARACGCRIVTYDTGGSAETVAGYEKSWVLQGDEKAPSGFVRLLNGDGGRNESTNVSVIILQKNEVLHIRRCLEHLMRLNPRQIFVVDSFSSDGSDKIAEELGATVIQRQWPGLYAPQFNWALENLPITSDWVIRLDADEYFLPEAIEELKEKLPTLPNDVTGVISKRRHYIFGGWAKRGTYPVKLLRVFRRGKAICENRHMDEHMLLQEGRAIEFKYDFIDHNLGDLKSWKEKHRHYAKREAVDAIKMMVRPISTHIDYKKIGPELANKRKWKYLYYRLPPYFRVLMYFCIRYLFRLGFLDGSVGLRWHFWQGFWYRWIVDREIGRLSDKHNKTISKSS